MVRTMLTSPLDFQGCLNDFYSQYVEPNLPIPEMVAAYHRLLVDYCEHEDPLFLLRKMRVMERGQIYLTTAGHRVRATDNAPAWWMHHLTFHGQYIPAGQFAAAIENAPVHMFEAAKHVPSSISKAGWYVAHIFSVKDGDTCYEDWGRHELSRRFLRNIHPCNHFYVPKMKPQRYGEDPDVIAYFAGRYADRYACVWPDFLQQVRGETLKPLGTLGAMPINIKPERLQEAAPGQASPGSPTVTYSYSRVCFLARYIEPLTDEATFRMVTPDGTFQMSKAEFYHSFPNITASDSYRLHNVYHRAKPMREILPYQVADPEL